MTGPDLDYDFLIRPLRLPDLTEVHRLHIEAFGDAARDRCPVDGRKHFGYSAVIEDVSHPTKTCLMAFALASVLPKKRSKDCPFGKTLCIDLVVVDPDLRRQGLGRNLLDYICNSVPSVARPVQAIVPMGEPVASEFFRALGYRAERVLRTAPGQDEHVLLVNRERRQPNAVRLGYGVP